MGFTLRGEPHYLVCNMSAFGRVPDPATRSVTGRSRVGWGQAARREVDDWRGTTGEAGGPAGAVESGEGLDDGSAIGSGHGDRARGGVGCTAAAPIESTSRAWTAYESGSRQCVSSGVTAQRTRPSGRRVGGAGTHDPAPWCSTSRVPSSSGRSRSPGRTRNIQRPVGVTASGPPTGSRVRSEDVSVQAGQAEHP